MFQIVWHSRKPFVQGCSRHGGGGGGGCHGRSAEQVGFKRLPWGIGLRVYELGVRV